MNPKQWEQALNTARTQPHVSYANETICPAWNEWCWQKVDAEHRHGDQCDTLCPCKVVGVEQAATSEQNGHHCQNCGHELVQHDCADASCSVGWVENAFGIYVNNPEGGTCECPGYRVGT